MHIQGRYLYFSQLSNVSWVLVLNKQSIQIMKNIAILALAGAALVVASCSQQQQQQQPTAPVEQQKPIVVQKGK